MADEDENVRTSFVNETFDDLESDKSDTNLTETRQGEELLTVPQPDQQTRPEHQYALLQDIVIDGNQDETTPPNHDYDLPITPPEPHYDTPVLPHYDEPNKPHPVEAPPTLALEEGLIDQRTLASIAPSKAIANGNHDDDINHRPLPPSNRKYDTIPDSLRSTATEDETMFDLQVNITGRDKQTTSTKAESFVIYRIETHSLRPRHLYEKPDYLVWRRYKDFEWLHGQLEKNHPTLILPPLPGKQIMRYLDHMSETFLEERQRCLDQFLWRIATHPFFSYDNYLKEFLTADNEQFAAHVQESLSGNKLLGMVSTSVKQAATSVRLKNPDNGFVENGKYFTSFSDKVGVLERIETRIQTERKELSEGVKDMGTVVDSWANSEHQINEGLRKVSGSFEAWSSALDSLNDSNAYSFQLALKMYQNYANSAVSALKRRDGLQLEHEVATEERDKKKKLHEDAVNAGKTDKVTKIAADLEKVGVTAEHTQDRLAQANEQLRVDVEKWKESKDDEMRQILINWSSNQIQFHERMFHEWEEALLLLRQLGSDSDFTSQY